MTPINKRYLVISIVILSIGLIFLMHIQFDIFSHKRGNVQKKLEVTNSTIEDAAVKDNIIENIQEKSHVNNNKVIRDVPKEEKPHADNNEVMKDVPQEENKTTLSAKEEDEMNNLFDDLLEELEIFDFKEIDIVPMLLSPNDCNLPSLDENSVSLDLNTLELFKKHNDMMDGMSRVDIEGHSQWSKSPKKLSPIKIEYTRAKQHGDVHCENAHCTVQGHLVKTFNDEFKPMLVDSLYLLMFRKYDPKKFKSVKDGELLRQDSNGEPISIPIKIVKSFEETLCFETQTGRLLQAEILSGKMGVITVDMDNYALVEIDKEHKSQKVALPLEVRLKIPESMSGRNSDTGQRLEIRLTIDGPEQIQIRTYPQTP